ncbi:glycoside hydrolase family 3 N-terminal domain-containing protein [Microbacterium sp. NPDC076911]|uniref:glycoside hydrolase family 3 N-terminal domain-containing protein n=1 Tax=Microbacterium sp. NPDC076911 TaxID=3154958 RepID=UPI00344395EE
MSEFSAPVPAFRRCRPCVLGAGEGTRSRGEVRSLMMAKRLIAALGLVCILALGLTTPATAVAVKPTSSDGTAHGSGVVRVESAAETAIDAAATARVAQMSVHDKAASVVMGHIPSTDPAILRAYMEDTGIGGFILMGANVPSSEQLLRELTESLTVDPAFAPLLAIDQEGGDVSRLPWDDFPSALTLKYDSAEAAYDAFSGRGGLILRAGIGVNFGVVADETDDPDMFIYRRVLGTNAPSAASRVAAAVLGESPSTMSTLKHFPGHGAAPGDSHAGIPETNISLTQWRETDAVPFQAGIDADAPLLMFGHLRYTSIDSKPATLSAKWHDIARKELGFSGVAITDDLGMLEASGIADYADPVSNAVEALVAGNDMVLTLLNSNENTAPRIVAGIVAATEDGTLSMERLEEAAQRVAVLRLELSGDGRGLSPCEDCGPLE